MFESNECTMGTAVPSKRCATPVHEDVARRPSDKRRRFSTPPSKDPDSVMRENIAGVLGCSENEIRDIRPIGEGMTNLTFHFATDSGEYVYRHPGAGSDEITDRTSEVEFQKLACELGIDCTFIHEDNEAGWKVSRYVANARYLDYHDWDEVGRACAMLRKLHESGARCGAAKDMHEDTLKMLELLSDGEKARIEDFAELLSLAGKLNDVAMANGARLVPCHNDFYDRNFLVADGEMDLIDWEFAGMSDYASDLAVFIACCPDYSYEQALQVFEQYFGQPLTREELIHCVAYSAVVSFHWLVWALYKDETGDPVGEFLDYYYRYTKMFGAKARELCGGAL